jgi:hypothetical protein
LAAGPTSPPLRGKVLMTLGAVVSQLTVKDASAVSKPLLAVLVNVPHFVVVATMVSVKGAVEWKSRGHGHVTVFPLVVHW